MSCPQRLGDRDKKDLIGNLRTQIQKKVFFQKAELQWLIDGLKGDRFSLKLLVSNYRFRIRQ
jgi:hypothetical protein